MKKAIVSLVLFATYILSGAALANGWNAGVYNEQGQVMQPGSAQVMKVVSVRPIQIQVAQQQQNAMGYAATAAGAAVGGIVGNSVDNPGSAGRNIATVLGGMLGGLAGNLVSNMTSGPSYEQGQEIIMVNQATNQTAVVSQGGQERFYNGESVYVVSMGGTTRVTAAGNL